MKKKKTTILAGSLKEKMLDALTACWENQLWPSAANTCRMMGRKTLKLRGSENRLRKSLLREWFDL